MSQAEIDVEVLKAEFSKLFQRVRLVELREASREARLNDHQGRIEELERR